MEINMKLFKKIIIIIVLLAFGYGSYTFFLKKDNSENQYITSQAVKGDIKKEIIATGTVNPVNVVKVGTQVSGTIEKIYADFNDKVKKGDLLADLDKSLLKTRIESAEAALKKAKVQKELAALEEKRIRELFDKEYVAEAELDKAKAAVKSAEADYKSAYANYKQAEINIGYTIIRSPVAGVIISREVDEGQTVAAGLQTPELFKIAEDLTKMQIEASISEADIGYIKKRQKVIFTVDAFEKDEFTGIVNLIRLNPATEQNVVIYTVIIEIDNSDMKILPGMTAFVKIIIAEKKNILKVRNSVFNVKLDIEDISGASVLPASNETVIFRLTDKKEIEPVTVEKGLYNETETEIISDAIKEEDILIEDIIKIGDNKSNRNDTRMRKPF
ncbi:MAG: efflux RND transporter periplasmic adaptor subunit [Deltaproteobacteria bacterium]|nr:efflux RND transporter periplasmic adaptor subunit [Deltaproteobacteria bacterium]